MPNLYTSLTMLPIFLGFKNTPACSEGERWIDSELRDSVKKVQCNKGKTIRKQLLYRSLLML